MLWFKVAQASEYLAITGAGIDDIKLAKKSWILPGQCCRTFDVSPVNYEFEVQAMSAEKLPFLLPAVFAVGPRVDDHDSLIRYARLISSHDKLSNDVKELVQGVIEGETRVLAASLTMEEIFKGTKEFKKEVFEKVQLELNQFGLHIYNANVKQLVDVRGHEYFSYLGQKIQQEAANQAKIDVSEAKMKGEIGAKERDGLTKQNAAKIDAETKVYSTKRDGEGRKEEVKVRTEVQVFENLKQAEIAQADAELAMKKAEWKRQSELKQVEAQKAIAKREAELQMEVEQLNASRQTEKLKAEHLTKAKVDYEMKVQEANWELYKKQKEAEAALYAQEKAAHARRAAVEADFFAQQQAAEGELYTKKKQVEARIAAAEADLLVRQKEAEGILYAKKKEAEALLVRAHAEGTYIRTLLESLGGNYAALRDYLLISEGTYTKLADSNAKALHGMQPKINVWTGAGEGIGGDDCGRAAKEMAAVYRMMPPLLQTVQDQTGMSPPMWLGKLEDRPTKAAQEM